jgi:hypothetical protein
MKGKQLLYARTRESKSGNWVQKKLINIGEGQVIAKVLATDGKGLVFPSML